MNQIPEEDSIEANELQNESQKIYNKTYPSNFNQPKENENNIIQSHSQNLEPISKSPHATIENIKKTFKNNSYSKSTNKSINIATITHNNTTLVKNLKYLDEDNIKLREALLELNSELKEKEEELNESQKIIRKINDEYSQMVNEFKILEDERNMLSEENEKYKKMYDNLVKNYNDYDKIKKQNEQLKIELIRTKEIMNNLKGNYNNVSNDYNKIEKDNQDKEIIIKDLKNEGSKVINMLQERELLIQNYSKKISELNEIIKQKDEQIKIMVNFSKELNDENKLNVKQLTKQAVETLKIFYNTINNKEGTSQVNFVEIVKSDQDKNIDKGNISDLIFGTNNNTDNSLKKSACSFLLNEAVTNVLYIPDVGINYINKEFLIDNNFKTCLLKTELFGSAIREIEFLTFFSNIFSYLNEGISNFNFSSEIQIKRKVNETTKKLLNIKKIYNELYSNIVEYKKENISLKLKLKDLNLYIIKLQKDFAIKIQKFKEKIKIYNNYVYQDNLKNKSKKQKNIGNNEKFLNEKNNDKIEISKLYQEIDRVKNINHNMNQEIMDKEEIINKLKNENEQLSNKLNVFRTNPNAENNFKFLNSLSIDNNNKEFNPKPSKKNSRNIVHYNTKYLSGNSNYNDIKYNTNKISTSNNDNLFNYSYNESASKNSMKYSTKTTSKNMSRKRYSVKNLFKNENDLSNKNYNENDISNIFIKSNNNFKNNFKNLYVKSQDNFSYIINKKLKSNNNSNYKPGFQNSSQKFEKEIISNIFSLIYNFKSEIKEDKFKDMTNKYFQTPKMLHILTTKIEEIKNNLSTMKEKFKNNHRDKQIKPSQLIDIIEQIEKLLLFIFNHLFKAENEIQIFLPYLKSIFDLISKIVYDIQYSSLSNMSDITPISVGVSTLQNTSISYNLNTKFNYSTIPADKIVKNNTINNMNIVDKITDDKNSKIKNTENDTSSRTKESLFPNIQELNQFFDINKKIFSSSELIKYKVIYEGLPISNLITVFKDICDNLKKTIYNSKNDYDSEVSDFEESNIFEEIKNSHCLDNNTYHIVNQKIFGLKKFEFNYKIFMELLKNYLVSFEIIVNEIEVEIENKNRQKQVELGEELKILYNIFEDAVYFKMDRLDDDDIFNRKVLLKLLLNHREYLSIIFDI